MLKDIRLGKKMALGFGLVILLLLLISGAAGINLLQIQQESTNLSDKHIPEMLIAVDVQVSALETMFATRGYAFSFQAAYAEESGEKLSELMDHLRSAAMLAQEQNLPVLAESAEKANDAAAAFQELSEETRAVINRLLAARDASVKAGDEFARAFAAFLHSQEEQFGREISEGLSADAMEERLRKITRGYLMLEAGNNTRLANLRGQANNDPAIIQAALSDFDSILIGLEEIRELTRNQSDLEELDIVRNNTIRYRGEMEQIINALVNLKDINEAREGAARNVLAAASTVVETGGKTAGRIASDAEVRVNSAVGVIIIGSIVALLLAIVIAVILTRGITIPVAKGVAFARAIALGDFEISLDIRQKDEIGNLAMALVEMLESLKYKAGILDRVSEGDLTVEVKKASEKDGLGLSLITMVDSLNNLLGEVNSAVDQVSAGSDQVSQASQSLSQGATEQASSLEEISSSSNEVRSQSKQNAEHAMEATVLAKKAAADARDGNTQMEELVEAMSRITASSDQINKVVKVIDDIAFQINLLALNANVEAARAGKYGKGFAVVAEEVRNLAVRAANAVKETSEMVDDSITNIKRGDEYVALTAGQLRSIVEGAGKVSILLEEIASASREQAQAIDQISNGLELIDEVTQSNTASAEESASASEELAAQGEQLKELVSRFRLKDSKRNTLYLADNR